MNFLQKWIIATIKDEDVKQLIAIRLNKLNPIMRDTKIRSLVGSFEGYHAHRNPKRGNHDAIRNNP